MTITPGSRQSGESPGSGSGSVTFEPGPGEMAGAQRREQRRRIDDRAAADVVEVRAALHRRQPRGREQAARLGGERQGDDDVVGLAQHLVEGGDGPHRREPGRQRAGRARGERRAPACRTPPPARRRRSRGRRRRSRRASDPRARTAISPGGGRHCRSSCARTSAGSCRANASISPSTCSAMLIAWLPLPLVSTRRSLATSFGVAILSMPAPRWCSHCRPGAASRMASIGGPAQAIAAASARSRPFGKRVAVEPAGPRRPGRASRNTCGRASSIGWRKAKVERRIGSTPSARPTSRAS